MMLSSNLSSIIFVPPWALTVAFPDKIFVGHPARQTSLTSRCPDVWRRRMLLRILADARVRGKQQTLLSSLLA